MLPSGAAYDHTTTGSYCLMFFLRVFLCITRMKRDKKPSRGKPMTMKIQTRYLSVSGREDLLLYHAYTGMTLRDREKEKLGPKGLPFNSHFYYLLFDHRLLLHYESALWTNVISFIYLNTFVLFFRLEFCSAPSQRTKKQKDILPDVCYRRLKGILFFNRHTPISNNKLKILLDERKDLSSALEDATAERRLPQEFRSWIEKCHKELDKEVGVVR